MKKSVFKSVIITILAVAFAAMSLLFVACGETEEPPVDSDPPKAPVSVAEAAPITIAVGKDKLIVVADYITTNGNPATAKSDSTEIATVKLENGIATVTAVAEGKTNVKLSCTGANVTVEKVFEVSCVVRHTVTVDGKPSEYDGGTEFTFPAATTPEDADMEFDYWAVGGKTEHYAPNDKITVNENLTVTAVYKRKAAESVKTTGTLSVAEGAVGEITVADYITTHGGEVKAVSSDGEKATAVVDGGVVKVTGVAEGTAKVTVSCGAVTAEITVTVTEYTGVKYTVTVNGTAAGEFKPNAEFTFPAATTSEDANMEFDYWAVGGKTEHFAPGNKIAVNENLTVTAVYKRKAAVLVKATGALELTVGQSGAISIAEYITTYGNAVTVSVSDPAKATATVAGGTVAVETLAVGEADIVIKCGEATATVKLTVSPRDEDAPVFDNVSLEIDLIEKESVSKSLSPSFVPSGKTFAYSYAAASGIPVSFEGDLLTYTPSGDKEQDIFTVTVTATPTEGDVKTVTFQVTVNVSDSRPSVKDSELVRAGTLDMFGCKEKLDLANNLRNSESVTSYTVAIDGGQAETSEREFALSSLKASASGLTEKELTLTVKAYYGEGKFVEYTYRLTVVDTSAYRVINGGFETGTLDGWTGNWEEGKPIANVTNADKYFADVEYGKDGEWLLSGACDFAANPDNGREDNMGTLESSPFTLLPNAVVTFKLGGAKNISTGIKFVKADGTVLAQFYNTNMLPQEGVLILYKYAFENEEAIENCRVVIYDYAGSGDWGLVVVDSIETYVTEAPATAVEAQNVYADKSALKAAIANAPDEQGDYTAQTYNALKAKIDSANAELVGDYISAARVAELIGEIGDAVDALEVRTPEAIAGTVKAFKLAPEGTKEIVVADYVDDKELSSLTYAVVSSETATATVSEVAGGKFTVTAVANGTTTVTLDVFYKDGASAALSVEFTFTVTDAADPTLKEESVIARSRHLDLFEATNKDEMQLDFSQFLDNPASVELSFTATRKVGDGEAEAITLEDGKYTLAFGSYTDSYTAIVFDVTVGYNITEAKTLSFTYTLYVRDTSAYRVANGGFENADDALADWSVTDGMGAVSTADTYWKGLNFGKEGDKLFVGEDNKGVGYRGELVSPEFTVGGSGFVTFRLGAAGHFTHQYVEVLNSAGNRVLARFYNTRYVNAGDLESDPDKVSGQTLMKYKADLSAYIGETVKLRIVDNWEVGDIGFVVFDDLVTYYENESDIDSAYTLAENYLNRVYNGDFETGNMNGWYKTGNIGDISSGTGYLGTAVGSEILYQKEGTFFFEGRENKVSEGEAEWKTGTLTSTVFTVGGSGYMTFFVGGGNHSAEQYVEIVDSSDGTVLARYANRLFVDAGGFDGDPYKVSGLTLMKYKADLSSHLGKTVFVRVVDNHVGGDFGMIHVDNFVTFYEDAASIGAEYNVAENVLA